MANGSLWQKLRFKYRISMVNEDTLTENWYLRLSKLGIFVGVSFLLLVSFALFALVIWFTPLRNYLPGYNENIRQSLLDESLRVDSITQKLSLQSQYLDVIRDVVAGEVESDSIKKLDSVTVAQRQSLLEQKSQVTEDFMQQYEAKEKEYLSIFDPQQIAPALTFFRPADGVVISHVDVRKKQYGVTIQTAKNENVTSVLAGTIVYAAYTITDEWVLMVQHENDYMSIYKHAGRSLKNVGDKVRLGESIGIVADTYPLYFELWQKGQAVNPEEVINF